MALFLTEKCDALHILQKEISLTIFADAFYEGGVHDRVTEPVHCNGLDDPRLPRLLLKAALAKLCEEVEMARGLCPPFDAQARREEPGLFRDALNNFAVRELLAGVGKLA